MESNTAMINDMINKLITMKPYLEGPPDGALQMQFGKTYNQVDALYQQWLQSDAQEEARALEGEWHGDGEIVRNHGIQTMDVSPSRSQTQAGSQHVATAHNATTSQNPDVYHVGKTEAMTDRRNLAAAETVIYVERGSELKFDAKSRGPLGDQRITFNNERKSRRYDVPKNTSSEKPVKQGKRKKVVATQGAQEQDTEAKHKDYNDLRQ